MKKDILGFQICGIGMGHLTQAKNVYDILIKKYEIPVIIIYGISDGFDNYFKNSLVVYEKLYTTNEDVNKNNLYKIVKDAFVKRKTLKYEREYDINKWFNFFVTDFFNYRTKQIHIAYQFAVPHISIFSVFILIILFSRSKIVNIQMPSLLTNKVIPPLIDLKKINREKINKKLIIAYSVSGTYFPNILITLAKKHKDYKFIYFTKTKIKNNLPNNIELNIPSKTKFKNYLKYCGAVLCTSGNELITECVYNKIPVATIYTSDKNFEQKFNFKKYVKKLNYALPMSENLNLNLLVNRNTEYSYKNLLNSLQDRDIKILNLCEI